MTEPHRGSPRPLVSVVVPARDAEAHLPGLLSALRAQTMERFELIVVDDGSRIRIAQSSGLPGRVIRRERPAGSYAARNAGIAAARGEVIAFTDADCRPLPDWLTAGLDDLQGCHLVAGRIDMTLRPQPSLAELVDAAHYLDQLSYAARGFGATANLIVRRTVFDRIGQFNERLISNGDREFCLRAAAAGFRLNYSERGAVCHAARTEPADVVRRSFRMGFGRAQSAVHAAEPARGSSWLTPGAYLPTWLGGRGEGRIRAVAGGGRQLLVEGLGYALVGGPLLCGYAVGAVLARSERVRPASNNVALMTPVPGDGRSYQAALTQGLAILRLPPRVTGFYLRALARALLTRDRWSLSSATQPRDLSTLIELARGRSNIVEIGTGTAWTTAALAIANPSCTVNSFDPCVRPARDRNLSALAPQTRRRIVLHELPGQRPAEPLDHVDLVFVDGGHDFETTVAVFEAWRPRLAPDGVVVFHDFGNVHYPGVETAIEHLELEGEVRGGLYVWRRALADDGTESRVERTD